MPLSLSPSLLMSSASSVAFSPLSLFASGEQGAWYDPSDLSTMFQDSAGTTPVTATGQTVGLLLDKSKGLVLGPELVTNGDFSNGATGWAGVNGTLSTSSGACVITADGAGQARAGQTLTTVVGRFYEARATLARGTGAVSVDLLVTGIASSASVSTTTPTEVVVRFTATSTSTTVRAGSVGTAVAGTTYIVDNISVKELPGNHATQATAASRPIYQVDGNGKAYLLFDGTDDFLLTGTITPGIDKAQVFAGVRKLSDAGDQALLETSAGASFNNGAISLFAPVSGGANYNYGSRGTTFRGTTAATFTAPITNVVTGTSDISGDIAAIRVNGVQASPNTGDQGTGNYLAYPFYIGRRAGTSLPFNGRIYQMLVRFGANLSADTITQTETFVNSRTGAY